MPGLRGPSDYTLEPPRHPALVINSKEPFNAEPRRLDLVWSYITPVEFFYKRNHGPIPVVDDLDKYSVSFTGLTGSVEELFMKDIWRTAMSKTRKVKGVGWDVAAIGNAVWGGAKLADVLELVGIPKCSRITPSGGKHVEFVSIDKCKEENGGPYKASIPLIQATNPEADVLLAYEMNGEGFFMQRDYKMFPPSVDWDNIDWSTRRPQMDFPVQCAICSLDDVNMVKPGKITIKGYAASGGGRGIERVDISIDGGKTWLEASKSQKSGVPYISDDESSDKWAWVLFEAQADIAQNTEIVAKAVDIAGNVQPENVEVIWNLRGILNTSWHRVQVRIGHSNL
ncbi:sulfite oxidase [Phtheirospermum japonicum]|uniref:Sulfite oxidase n=1 Tax=Phtheirospermum japonicum TaxID=374723 RepID=A0A830CVD0_9LAMI|nr:sulfite oxidase [Phtheirospermum japonicum]